MCAWRGALTWEGFRWTAACALFWNRNAVPSRNLGCIVEEACPDLSGADKIFLDIRLWSSFNVLGPLLETHRSQMKPDAIWQIEVGAGSAPRTWRRR